MQLDLITFYSTEKMNRFLPNENKPVLYIQQADAEEFKEENYNPYIEDEIFIKIMANTTPQKMHLDKLLNKKLTMRATHPKLDLKLEITNYEYVNEYLCLIVKPLGQ